MEWLWVLLVFAIILAPIVAAVVRGVRDRDARVPRHEDASEAHGVIMAMKDTQDRTVTRR